MDFIGVKDSEQTTVSSHSTGSLITFLYKNGDGTWSNRNIDIDTLIANLGNSFAAISGLPDDNAALHEVLETLRSQILALQGAGTTIKRQTFGNATDMNNWSAAIAGDMSVRTDESQLLYILSGGDWFPLRMPNIDDIVDPTNKNNSYAVVWNSSTNQAEWAAVSGSYPDFADETDYSGAVANVPVDPALIKPKIDAKLDKALTSGYIYLGNGSNVATAVQLSGDVTMNNAGVTVIGAGKILTAMIANSQVTFAKMQNIATNKLLGRSTSGSGNIEEITIGTGLSLSGGTLNATGTSVTVDPTPTDGSPNPVSSDGVFDALAGKSNVGHTHTASDITGLGAVATSNDYNDLSNKPTIPAAYTDEQAQDAVGAMLSSDFVYNDSTPSVSIANGARNKRFATTVNLAGGSTIALAGIEWYDVFKINATGSDRSIAAITGTFIEGQLIEIRNVSASTKLTFENPAFLMDGQIDLQLFPGDTLTLEYDGTDWKQLHASTYAAVTLGGGGGSPTGSAGGDLSGTYPNPTVARLQGVPVDTTAPTSGQVLKYDGTKWAPGTDNTGGTAAWGGITGTLSSQTDLQNALNAKANLAGDNSFTGGGIQKLTGSGSALPSLRLIKTDLSIPNYSGVLTLDAGTVATWGFATASNGGAAFAGYSANVANSYPVIFAGTHGHVSPTVGATLFIGRKHNGTTGFAALANTEIIADFWNLSTSVFKVLGNGDLAVSGQIMRLSNSNAFYSLAQTGFTPVSFASSGLVSPAAAANEAARFSVSTTTNGGAGVSGYSSTSDLVVIGLNAYAGRGSGTPYTNPIIRANVYRTDGAGGVGSTLVNEILFSVTDNTSERFSVLGLGCLKLKTGSLPSGSPPSGYVFLNINASGQIELKDSTGTTKTFTGV